MEPLLTNPRLLRNRPLPRCPARRPHSVQPPAQPAEIPVTTRRRHRDRAAAQPGKDTARSSCAGEKLKGAPAVELADAAQGPEAHDGKTVLRRGPGAQGVRAQGLLDGAGRRARTRARACG